MDRNTFTGLFLILIILVGSTYFMQPSEQEIQKEKLLQDSTARAVTKTPLKTKTADTVTLAAKPLIDSAMLSGPFGAASTGNNQPVIMENEVMKVSISPKGGRVASVLLKNFKTYDQKPLILFEGDTNKFGLLFGAAGKNINTNNFYFTSSAPSISVSKQDSSSLTMRLNYADGKYIDYIYSLKGGSYKVGFTIATKGMEDVISTQQQQLILNWEAVLKQKEDDIVNENRYSTAYYKHVDGDVDYLSLNESESKEINEGGKIQWISFKQHFFSNVLIAKNGFSGGTLAVSTSTEKNIVKGFKANMQLPFTGQDVSYPMEFYFGPNKISILEDFGYDISKQVDLGYWPLKYINRWIVLPVFNFLEGF